jgi:rhodanese-related sulfurtransferase
MDGATGMARSAALLQLPPLWARKYGFLQIVDRLSRHCGGDGSMADDQELAEPFRRIQPEEARTLIDSGQVTVVDVREAWEYEKDHIAGSKLIPLARIIGNPAQITSDNVVFVCEVGQRSGVAAEVAASLGYENLYNLEGGMSAWRSHGYPVEK